MCTVHMGDTHVMAQVSCEITEPRASRVNEGLFQIDVEISPLCSKDSEIEELYADNLQLKRSLDTSLKESRCIDLESLCITAGSKVWSIRVDITIINYEGNMLDSCCLAAIGALAHFKRPNVSVLGETVKVHNMNEADPIPLCLHHMPLCVTFICYNKGEVTILDTTRNEEFYMDGSMVLSLNKHRELCTLLLNGGVLFTKEQFISSSRIAYAQVEIMSNLVTDALEMDNKLRLQGSKQYGFAETAGIEESRSSRLKRHDDISDSFMKCLQESKQEAMLELEQQEKEQHGVKQEQKEEEEAAGDADCLRRRGGDSIQPVYAYQPPIEAQSYGSGAHSTWDTDVDWQANSLQLSAGASVHDDGGGGGEDEGAVVKAESGPMYGEHGEELTAEEVKRMDNVMRDTDSDESEGEMYQLTESELNNKPRKQLRRGNMGVKTEFIHKVELMNIDKDGEVEWTESGHKDQKAGDDGGIKLSQNQIDQIEDMMSDDSDSDY